MSKKDLEEDDTGNSEKDWEIFDVLCRNMDKMPNPKDHHHHFHHSFDPPCTVDHITGDHLSHSIDLATTLRSELAALTYKRDRLMGELSETKGALCSKENECETLRAQSARQSALIISLQQRLQATEAREKNLQVRSEQSVHSLQRDKRCLEEKLKEVCSKARRLEVDFASEESLREQARNSLHELIRKLGICLGMDVCDSSHLTPECVLAKANESVVELQRLRTKLSATCENLTTCESELHSLRNSSTTERSHMQAQIESLKTITTGLEARCKTAERDLQLTRDRLTECEMSSDKLREELRGFESRCCRLQTSLDRVQTDRLAFLKNIGSIINVTEPCETVIKDKIREITNENQNMHNQNANLRDQLTLESNRLRESQETSQCRIRAEECQRATLEEKLEKQCVEMQQMRSEHMDLAEYLVRLARALCWSDCIDSPTHGAETNSLAQTLLDRAEQLAIHSDHHRNHAACDKTCFDLPTPHHHHHHLPKIRRERSCHDIPLKESSTVYSLQRRVRVLREQVQRRDLHLELLRRKIALLEENARGKAILQTERDEALCRARRNNKQTERTQHQLMEVKTQLADVKAQLADATDYKITALERARKIDELQARVLCLENEKSRLISQLNSYKTRARSAVDCSNDRRIRDEAVINNCREELARVKSSLADANHRLSQLQTFRSSVARLLHVRDIPECDILGKLQTLCNAHQEFTLLSRRYETASPVPENPPCPRYEDPPPPSSSQCRPRSTSPPRRFIDSGFDHHFEDDFEFSKKF